MFLMLKLGLLWFKIKQEVWHDDVTEFLFRESEKENHSLLLAAIFLQYMCFILVTVLKFYVPSSVPTKKAELV